MNRTSAWAIAPLLACLTAGLAAMALCGPAGRNPALFMAVYPACFACLYGLVRFFPPGISFNRGLALILVPAVGVKVLFVLYYPADRDLARYIWEGLVQLRGQSPFALAPSSPELAGLRLAHPEVYGAVGHANLAAIYPPLSQLIFAAQAWAAPTALGFKALLAAFDLGTALVLARVLRARGLPVSRLALYALNPLVCVYVSGEGHLDVLAVFFLALALPAFTQGRDGPGFFALGLAVMAKYTVLPALPFFLAARNYRKAWLALSPGLLFLPYLAAGGLFSSVVLYGTDMASGGGIAALLRLGLGHSWLPAALVLAAAALIFIWLTEPDVVRGAYLGIAAVLMLSPTLYPWYLCAVALFMPLAPSRPWLLFMAAQALTFPAQAASLAAGQFTSYPWLTAAAYAVFFLSAAHDGLLRRRMLPAAPFAPVASLVVLIPALNEATNIAACLDSVARASRGLSGPVEVIVADGGSTDATAAIAAERGAKVVASARGRGLQIRTAIDASNADCLLILHADCRLAPDAPATIMAALGARPGAAGGALGMRFDPDFRLSALVSRLNTLKTWLTGISFGDQGQFLRREALARLGGFPDMELMEDVELSLRLRGLGETIYFGRGVTASPRAWSKLGLAGNFRRILPLLLTYLVRRRLGLPIDAAAYYRTYYRGAAPDPAGAPPQTPRGG